ncbi:MAG: hypothetical protein FJ125_06950 [Deltaproteobacteria bacterium]|nr:hypothetical protein [Deltaproteobacteria bacterium]
MATRDVTAWISVLLAAGLLNCSDDTRRASGGTGADGEGENEGSGMIGTSGGSVMSADDLALLRVPEGALSEATRVTLGVVDETGPEGALSPVYEIGPDGVFFQGSGATLEIEFVQQPSGPGGDPTMVRWADAIWAEDKWEPVETSQYAADPPRVRAVVSSGGRYSVLLTGQPLGECDAHSDCAGDTWCLDGACEPPSLLEGEPDSVWVRFSIEGTYQGCRLAVSNEGSTTTVNFAQGSPFDFEGRTAARLTFSYSGCEDFEGNTLQSGIAQADVDCRIRLDPAKLPAGQPSYPSTGAVVNGAAFYYDVQCPPAWGGVNCTGGGDRVYLHVYHREPDPDNPPGNEIGIEVVATRCRPDGNPEGWPLSFRRTFGGQTWWAYGDEGLAWWDVLLKGEQVVDWPLVDGHVSFSRP